jgi:hypothetical protein
MQINQSHKINRQLKLSLVNFWDYISALWTHRVYMTNGRVANAAYVCHG